MRTRRGSRRWRRPLESRTTRAPRAATRCSPESCRASAPSRRRARTSRLWCRSEARVSKCSTSLLRLRAQATLYSEHPEHLRMHCDDIDENCRLLQMQYNYMGWGKAISRAHVLSDRKLTDAMASSKSQSKSVPYYQCILCLTHTSIHKMPNSRPLKQCIENQFPNQIKC